MKKTIKILIVIILLFLYVYVYNIEVIPSNIVLFEGESLNIKVATGLSFENNNSYKTALVSSSLNKQYVNSVGNNTLSLNLFSKIKIKDVNVAVIPNTSVVPIGSTIGMKLYTKGVLVVGMSEIETDNNKKVKPFEHSGIEEGDAIIAVNNKEVSSTDDLINQVNEGNGKKLDIKYMKNNKVLEANIIPAKTGDKYKIGLWVRDATAGVGTLTFYEPSTSMFMSLGHGIVDVDTGEIVNIASGELVSASIISIVKGQKDAPGEVRGTISNGNSIGQIYRNTNLGVYGKITSTQNLEANNFNEVQVAPRNEIEEGKATILCQIDNNSPKEYEIMIEKIYVENNQDNKSMLVKITDKNLLDKTGGIIQGMSGAPVLQNGKLIGAITNVLVKDPTQGYAVFGDLLIKQMREVQ